MKTAKHFKMLAIVIFCLTTMACGKNNSPAAFHLVDPQSDPEFAAKYSLDGSQPMTLVDALALQGVPKHLSAIAMTKYHRFSSRVRNRRYISMIDFTQHSSRDRLYIVDTHSGRVDSLVVAHGRGSDPDRNGYAQYFSNRRNSKMSSLGSYIVGETYQSAKHGKALKMDGLERTNSAARARGVTMHGAKYVYNGQSRQGMSWGCTAISTSWMGKAIQRLANGSFLYAYGINKGRSFTDELPDLTAMINPAAQWLDEGEDAPEDGEY